MPDALALLRRLRKEKQQQQQEEEEEKEKKVVSDAGKTEVHPDYDIGRGGSHQRRQPAGPRRDFWEGEEQLLLREWPVFLASFENNVRETPSISLRREHVATLRVLEDPLGKHAAGNGATLWDCSLALSRFLEYRFASVLPSAVSCSSSIDQSATEAPPPSSPWLGARVLELGAGLGLVSMTLASLGAHVTATERPICMALLERNIKENGLFLNSKISREGVNHGSVYDNEEEEEEKPVQGSAVQEAHPNARRGCCRVACLDWSTVRSLPGAVEEEESSGLCCDDGGGCGRLDDFDVVVGADLAFPSNAENFEALADVLALALHDRCRGDEEPEEGRGALHHRGRGDLKVRREGWLAHEERRPEVESRFWEALKRRHISAVRMKPWGTAEQGHQQGTNSGASAAQWESQSPGGPLGQPHPTHLPPKCVVECQSPEIGIYRLLALDSPGGSQPGLG